VFGLVAQCKADPSPNKVDLVVGAYRDDNHQPYVLNVVKKAEQMVLGKTNKEYLPIDGLPEFRSAAAKLILGEDSPAIKQGRVATFQSLSGTGALSLGAVFIKTFFPDAIVYISNPTWAIHQQIFQSVGLQVRTYYYYDATTKSIGFDKYIEDLKLAPSGSVILFHACAHNPTGIDPTPSQWESLADVVKEKKHIPFFDSAYQGFATGSLERDAFAVRLFVQRGFELLIAQSFAKNLGLYGERIGLFSIVSSTPDPIPNITSQVKVMIRRSYSNPPMHGAHIVSTILNDPALFKEWQGELDVMSSRIKQMRQALYDYLVDNKTPGNWTHILTQIGMFSFSGLNETQVEVLQSKHHIYLTKNGRISIPGLTTKNVKYVADAITDAVLHHSSNL